MLSARLALRIGRHRFLLRFPPRINRWGLLATFAIVAPVGYVLSAVPTVAALRRSGLASHPMVDGAITVVYAPLIWLDMNFPVCRNFFQMEASLIEWMFG